jgi:hypothetical protein
MVPGVRRPELSLEKLSKQSQSYFWEQKYEADTQLQASLRPKR